MTQAHGYIKDLRDEGLADVEIIQVMWRMVDVEERKDLRIMSMDLINRVIEILTVR